MRRPATRKIPQPAVRPGFFPPENVLTQRLPPALAGQRDFEQFHFLGFELSGASLAGQRFSDCLFENCSLAGVSLAGASLQNVAFVGCKLLGVQFGACQDMLFGVHFDKCLLDYASFAGKWMPTTRFADCSLREVSFVGADLTNAAFANCQLGGATFERTVLRGADLRTAHDLTLDPELNELKQARLALHALPGLLGKYGLLVE